MFRRISLVQLAGDFEGSTSTRNEVANSSRKSPTPAFPGSSGVHAGQTGIHPRAWICPRSSRICRRSSQLCSRTSWFHRGRRQDGAANPTRQEGRGLPPDEVMANARARVSNLEAGIAAVGDSDPTCAMLREALARAKSQAQECPVVEEGSCTSGGCEDSSGGGGGRTREVGKGRSLVARRRSSSAGVATGRGQRDGLPGCVLELQTERDDFRAKL